MNCYQRKFCAVASFGLIPRCHTVRSVARPRGRRVVTKRPSSERTKTSCSCADISYVNVMTVSLSKEGGGAMSLSLDDIYQLFLCQSARVKSCYHHLVCQIDHSNVFWRSAGEIEATGMRERLYFLIKPSMATSNSLQSTYRGGHIRFVCAPPPLRREPSTILSVVSTKRCARASAGHNRPVAPATIRSSCCNGSVYLHN